MWTTEAPDAEVEIDLDRGEAVLELEDICSVFDAFSVANSLDPAHPLGFVGAVLESLRIRWSGISRRRSFSNSVTKFRGNYVESTAATIEVTVRTPPTRPPFTPTARNGFEFTSDPASTVVGFAQIGHENNGSLF